MWSLINCYNGLSEFINDEFLQRIDLNDYEISACRSCGACGASGAGRCVIKDDFEEVSKRVVKNEGIIYVTPVTFGGYSSKLKYFIDRTMCYGLPLYYTHKGKMLHPMRYDIKKLIVIGIHEGLSILEEESFMLHVQRNALNMQMSFKGVLVHKDELSNFKLDLEKLKSFREAI